MAFATALSAGCAIVILGVCHTASVPSHLSGREVVVGGAHLVGYSGTGNGERLLCETMKHTIRMFETLKQDGDFWTEAHNSRLGRDRRCVK